MVFRVVFYSMSTDLSKIEKSAYTVFYEPEVSRQAHEMLEKIMLADDEICLLYGLKVPFVADFYLFSTLENYRAYTEKDKLPEDSIKLCLDKFPEEKLTEKALRELGTLIFEKVVQDKNNFNQLRSPSWMKEGLALQLSFADFYNKKDLLIEGWNNLRELINGKGLIPFSLMEKDINYIPNPQRRKSAEFQAYFMVKLILTVCGKTAFAKYAEIMSNNIEETAENAFKTATNLDFKQFYAMFKICVENNAAII